MVQAIHNLVSAPTCTEVLASTTEYHSPALTVSRKTLKAVKELPAQVGRQYDGKLWSVMEMDFIIYETHIQHPLTSSTPSPPAPPHLQKV